MPYVHKHQPAHPQESEPIQQLQQQETRVEPLSQEERTAYHEMFGKWPEELKLGTIDEDGSFSTRTDVDFTPEDLAGWVRGILGSIQEVREKSIIFKTGDGRYFTYIPEIGVPFHGIPEPLAIESKTISMGERSGVTFRPEGPKQNVTLLYEIQYDEKDAKGRIVHARVFYGQREDGEMGVVFYNERTKEYAFAPDSVFFHTPEEQWEFWVEEKLVEKIVTEGAPTTPKAKRLLERWGITIEKPKKPDEAQITVVPKSQDAAPKPEIQEPLSDRRSKPTPVTPQQQEKPKPQPVQPQAQQEVPSIRIRPPKEIHVGELIEEVMPYAVQSQRQQGTQQRYESRTQQQQESHGFRVNGEYYESTEAWRTHLFEDDWFEDDWFEEQRQRSAYGERQSVSSSNYSRGSVGCGSACDEGSISAWVMDGW